MLALIFIESFPSIYNPKSENSRKIVIPKEWKRRAVSIAGASNAYYWHIHHKQWVISEKLNFVWIFL
jgi:hypothetical protein